MSTDGHDYVMEFKTLNRVFEIMPQNLSWNGAFVLGLADAQKLTMDNWKDVVRERTDNTPGTIAFVNFKRHGVLKDEHQVYLDGEMRKEWVLKHSIANSAITVLPQYGQSRLMFTSADPTHKLVVGCIPHRCDILVTRAELVDAIPMECLEKYLKPDGIILHHGRLKNEIKLTTIDASLIDVKSFDEWMDKFVAYAGDSTKIVIAHDEDRTRTSIAHGISSTAP